MNCFVFSVDKNKCFIGKYKEKKSKGQNEENGNGEEGIYDID